MKCIKGDHPARIRGGWKERNGKLYAIFYCKTCDMRYALRAEVDTCYTPQMVRIAEGRRKRLETLAERAEAKRHKAAQRMAKKAIGSLAQSEPLPRAESTSKGSTVLRVDRIPLPEPQRLGRW